MKRGERPPQLVKPLAMFALLPVILLVALRLLGWSNLYLTWTTYFGALLLILLLIFVIYLGTAE